MAEKTERDQFDDLAPGLDRRGVHRAPKRRGAGFVPFAWAALATGALVVGGVGTLIITSDSMSLKDFEQLFALPSSISSPTPEKTATPTMDPSSVLSVINATGQSGIASQVGSQLGASGWSVGTTTNADKEVKSTVVYFGDSSLEGAARGVVEALGVGEIKLTDHYKESSSQLTLIIGKDFLK